MGLSPDKLLFVKEVDLTRLNNLQRTFKEDESAISFDTTDGTPKPDIDKTPYEVWTESPEQNERLRIGQTCVRQQKTKRKRFGSRIRIVDPSGCRETNRCGLWHHTSSK